MEKNNKIKDETAAKDFYVQDDRFYKIFDESKSVADILNEALNLARVEETGIRIPNFIELTSNATVDETFTLAAPCTQMQFRMVCVANWQSKAGNGALAAPNSGTCRIAAVDGELESTSPVFEVVE